MGSPPKLHPLYNSSLSVAVRAFSRTASAWREVSTTGANQAVRAANGLITLEEHAAYDPSPRPVPGALAVIGDDAAAALSWLQSGTDRLARALRGLEDHSSSLACRGCSTSSSVASGPVLATLDPMQWADLYSSGVACFRRDLEDKVKFVDALVSTLFGTTSVNREELETGAEMWLEMPRLHSTSVDLVVAAYDAEIDALETMEASRNASEDAKTLSTPSATTSSGGQSPALRLLLGGESGFNGNIKKNKN